MAKTEIKTLVRTLKDIYDGESWYGESIIYNIQNISSEQAFYRPIPEAHSIAELIAHMTAWRQLLLKRLQGDTLFSVEQEDSFNWKRIDPNPETAWKSLLRALDDNQTQLLAALETKEDAFLNETVAQRDYAFRVFIRGIIQHDIYHLGQIVLLAKATLPDK